MRADHQGSGANAPGPLICHWQPERSDLTKSEGVQFGLNALLLMGPRAPSPACGGKVIGENGSCLSTDVRARAPAVPARADLNDPTLNSKSDPTTREVVLVQFALRSLRKPLRTSR